MAHTTRTDGTGPGLSLSYGIVPDQQSTVDVHTGQGRGTTVVPAVPAAAEGQRQ